MLSNPLTLASALVLCFATSASAQQQLQQARVLGPVKDAGIYHVSTGTWTRSSGQQANLGPDIIYRNDHSSGYFGVGWEGAQGVDEGMLPGMGHPFSGSQDSYLINGLSFSYCALGAGPGITWDLFLYDSYVPCDDPDIPAHCINLVWTMNTGNLPGNSACWLVTLDLTGGAEACMQADGGPCAPGYQGPVQSLDHFGFGQIWLNNGNFAGPLLAGNPNWTGGPNGRGDGTCYLPGLKCPAGATGLGAQDWFAIGTPTNGCNIGSYWISGGCGKGSLSPLASFDCTLFADCALVCDTACEQIICDEAQDPNNVADATVNDDCGGSDGSLILFLSNATPNKATYALISTGSGAAVNPPGANGTLCVADSIGRYAQDISVISGTGTAQLDLMNAVTGGGGGGVPNIGGNIVGGTWNCQWWYRHQNTATGSRFSSLVTFGPVQ